MKKAEKDLPEFDLIEKILGEFPNGAFLEDIFGKGQFLPKRKHATKTFSQDRKRTLRISSLLPTEEQ